MDLDIGSGGGHYQSMPRGDVCIDIDYPKLGVCPDNFIIADAHNLPFKDEVFNNSSAHNVLEHVQDPNRVISEMLRVSKLDCHFTQDKLWSIGAWAETDHLWMQLPSLRFIRLPRTRLGIGFGRFLRTVGWNRCPYGAFRRKIGFSEAIVTKFHKYPSIENRLMLPHEYWRIKKDRIVAN